MVVDVCLRSGESDVQADSSVVADVLLCVVMERWKQRYRHWMTAPSYIDIVCLVICLSVGKLLYTELTKLGLGH